MAARGDRGVFVGSALYERTARSTDEEFAFERARLVGGAGGVAVSRGGGRGERAVHQSGPADGRVPAPIIAGGDGLPAVPAARHRRVLRRYSHLPLTSAAACLVDGVLVALPHPHSGHLAAASVGDSARSLRLQ